MHPYWFVLICGERRRLESQSKQPDNRDVTRSRLSRVKWFKAGLERSVLLSAVDLYDDLSDARRVFSEWRRTVDGAELPLVGAGEDFFVQSLGLLELSLLQVAGGLERRDS